MKTIYEHAVGGDGAVAGIYIDAEAGFVVEQVRYPLAKATDPIKKIVNDSIDGLEAKIPGDWDKAILEPIRAGALAEVDKVIGSL